MTPQQFNTWRRQWDLTIEQAAEVLGMKKAQIGRYNSGAAPIPKSIAMACNWYSYSQFQEQIIKITS